MLAVTVGSEVRLNTYTTENQHSVRVDYDAAGNYVAVWTSIGQDGSVDGVFARRFNAAGAALGSEFQVNVSTGGRQFAPDVAVDPDGDFVVVWSEKLNLIAANYNVYARCYNSAGAPVGNPFLAHFLSHTGDQALASVAMADSGRFTIVWQDPAVGVRAQQFSSGGTGGEGFPIDVSETPGGWPDVAMSADDRKIFVWHDLTGIRARIFDEFGDSVGPSFIVNTATQPLQQLATVGTDADGNFVVAWEGGAGSAVDTVGIHARRFDLNGQPLGSQFLVNTYTTQDQGSAAIGMNADGEFVIAWESATQEGTGFSGIYAQHFRADGSRKGGEFHVNTYTTGTQNVPDVAIDPDGDFIVAWASTQGQDGNLSGVYAQRFSHESPPLITSSQFVWLTGPQRLEVGFDQDVSGSLAVSDLQLVNPDQPALDLSGSMVMAWNSGTNRATFSFPTLAHGGSLPNGSYVATITATSITNVDGEVMTGNLILPFFFINGDATHNGTVDARDLLALANNWLKTSGVDYAKADFNYDGLVNQADLTILAQNWQVSLASLSPGVGGPPQPTAPGTRPPVRTPIRNTATPVISLVTDTTPAPTSSARSASRTPARSLI